MEEVIKVLGMPMPTVYFLLPGAMNTRWREGINSVGEKQSLQSQGLC